jgi:hypothetical protein
LAFTQSFEAASTKPNPLGYIDLGGGVRVLSGQTRCGAVDTRVIPREI